MAVDMSFTSVELSDAGSADARSLRYDLLRISVHSMKDCTILILDGEVCLASVPLLYGHLADIASELRHSLILDLGLVTLLDARGLSFLVAAHQQLITSGAQLIVFAPSRLVRHVFELTRLATYLMIVPDGLEGAHVAERTTASFPRKMDHL
jgi:anti-anti-sigma factor